MQHFTAHLISQKSKIFDSFPSRGSLLRRCAALVGHRPPPFSKPAKQQFIS
jgi:hypothetical protein